ncbi:MAG TPA: glycosyltransferase family 39 protein [Xanthobacteraceae bacterium]|nr:glycosyltransferase family 39 protein [Xanthobacteraceae bacterium]
MALTFRDYGLGWDDFTHAQYGELLLAFYGSGFADQRALSFVNLHMYGGGFDMAAALLAKLLQSDLFETRRLAGGLIGVLGLAVTWRLARRVGGPLAGFFAVILLAACPVFFGHMLMNAKDAPFAVAMIILLLALVRLLSEYPRPGVASIALFGLGLGVSIGSRTLGTLAGVNMLAALALLAGLEARAKGMREALLRAGRFVIYLIPGLLLAYAVMALVWPWSVQAPLNPWRAVTYFSHFFEHPWRELFAGELILVPDMPRSYVPTLFALQLPEIFLALGVSGLLGACYAAARRDLPARQRAIFLCVAMAAVFPIALTVALRPAMYNGIRHFVFVLPPLAVLGGLAGAWLFDWSSWRFRFGAAAAAILFGLGVMLPAIEMVRLHPYQYTYFNRLAGGVAGAQSRYMLDYWGLSFKQASQALAAKIAADKMQKPAGRPWKVAVCGPHPSPRVELGQDFEMSWDPQGADFALMLGTFYCREFDAPVLAEIRREGVLYARVYDLRGRSYPSLFNPYPGQN